LAQGQEAQTIPHLLEPLSMKCSANAILLLLVLAPAPTRGARVSVTPMAQVAELLKGVQARIEKDGESEQASYDKYACWCESTLGRKSSEISSSKELIEDLDAEIKELKAQISSHGAQIEGLKGDIKANTQAQRDATEIREKESADYTGEKTESEQCIGALEAAIKVLTAGTSKKGGFLETLQEAQLMGVAAGVRSAIKHALVAQSVSAQDLDLVKRFVSRPEDYVGGRAGISAAQIAHNPFGDYAPQSTQIQGILKGMYDAFVADLEKSNVEEAELQKSYESLMQTKRTELSTLEATLEKQTLEKAEKTEKSSENQQLRDETIDKLKADKGLFTDIKQGCKTKAAEWSERTRLRTEELNGIVRAVQLLTSSEAQKVFQNATTTFMQLSATVKTAADKARSKAYMKLKALAMRYHSYTLAEVAATVRTGSGYFDKVITSVDKMIEALRKEEQSDIEHRDRCQNSMGKNKNDMEDLAHAMEKADATIKRMENEADELKEKIDALAEDIKGTKDDMALSLKMRNEEHEEFVQALKDDTAAVAILEKTINSLTKFYRRNKVDLGVTLSLSQKKAPEYTENPDEAPETNWKGGNYGGRKAEGAGIVSIVDMLKQDLEKEIGNARRDDAKAQQTYEEERKAANGVLEKQTSSKMTLEQEKTELEEKKLDMEGFKEDRGKDLDGEKSLENSIGGDCSWIETHFDSRKEKRKAEMDGLVEAKGYLAGVESGEELAP